MKSFDAQQANAMWNEFNKTVSSLVNECIAEVCIDNLIWLWNFRMLFHLKIILQFMQCNFDVFRDTHHIVFTI